MANISEGYRANLRQTGAPKEPIEVAKDIWKSNRLIPEKFVTLVEVSAKPVTFDLLKTSKRLHVRLALIVLQDTMHKKRTWRFQPGWRLTGRYLSHRDSLNR